MTSKLRETILLRLDDYDPYAEYTLDYVIDAVIDALPNPELPSTVAGKNIAHGYHMAINDVKTMLEEAKDNE